METKEETILRLKHQLAEYDEVLCRRCGFNIKFEMFEGEGLRASCAKCDDDLTDAWEKMAWEAQILEEI